MFVYKGDFTIKTKERLNKIFKVVGVVLVATVLFLFFSFVAWTRYTNDKYSSVRECDQCGAFSSRVRYCYGCGADLREHGALEERGKCENCGKRQSSNYCTKCGSRGSY